MKTSNNFYNSLYENTQSYSTQVTGLSQPKNPKTCFRQKIRMSLKKGNISMNEESPSIPRLKKRKFTQTTNNSISDKNEISFRERRLLREISIRASRPKKPTKIYPCSNPNPIILSEFRDEIKLLSRNSQKYRNPYLQGLRKTQLNNMVKPLSNSTLYIKTNKEKSYLFKRLLKARKENIPPELHRTLRWEAMRRLWKNHLVLLNEILNKFSEYKWFLIKDEFMSKPKLGEFFQIVNQNYKPECIEDVFDIFGRNDYIYVKDFIHCIIVSDTTMKYNQKLECFLDLWSEEESDTIVMKELIRLIKFNLYFPQDIYKITNILKPLGSISNVEKVHNAFMQENLKKIFARNLRINYHEVQKNYQMEVTNVYNENMRKFSQITEPGMQVMDKGALNVIQVALKAMEYTRERKILKDKFLEEYFSENQESHK